MDVGFAEFDDRGPQSNLRECEVVFSGHVVLYFLLSRFAWLTAWIIKV